MAGNNQPAKVDKQHDADAIEKELEALTSTDPSKGLTDAEVTERLARFGKNELPEVRSNPILKFLGYFTGSIAYLLEIACILSAVLGNWPDFVILLFVLVANAIIGFHEEAKAESALDALKNSLALKTRAWRNGQLVEVEASLLVPGDVIALRLGDIVPADAKLLGIGVTGEITEGALEIDQAALTGESLPVRKGTNEVAYSSSIIKQGAMLAVVTKTGINTYIGRAANLISITNEEGHFQKIIKTIGNFLIIITIAMATIIFIYDMVVKKINFKLALKETVIITIAAIPVGLPTVMSVTMAVGAGQLAKKKVIVKRLTAIEELASVSILCSDKTGTLTMNKLTFDKPYLANKGNTPNNPVGTGVQYTSEELLLHSFFASEPGAQDPIESAVRKASQEQVKILKERANQDHVIPGYKVTNFTPFNPVSKYTEGTVLNLETKETFRVIKGAPQVITKICGGLAEADKAVIDLAQRGLRALGVAKTIDSENSKFELIGLISLLDPPREDSAKTIRECEQLGVTVKMITGDQLIIAKEVAQRLGMNRAILDAHKLVDPNLNENELIDRCVKADGFAHVIPEHKFRVVELLQKRGYLVGMTGDGVNDAPALKKANVGIAVEGCTEAARSAADIVLLAEGLSTIIDGIKCSRGIFQRMRSYALYRIASTIHFLLFFFFSILIYDFSLPDRLILLICVLNDAATLVIAVDNARISKRPDKWRLGQLLTLSFVLGFLLMIISFLHFWFARSVFPYTLPVVQTADGEYIENQNYAYYQQIQTIMYLQISSCPHFVIFSTRLGTWWWKSMPSMTFIVAILGTQVVAGLITIFGPKILEAVPIGIDWTLGVLAVSLIMFMLLDVVKVMTFKYWSFKLTAMLWPSPARRDKLSVRETRRIVLNRYENNVKKVRRCILLISAARAFIQAGNKGTKKDIILSVN
ncbi:H(+)-ATPase [Globomyces pollinis-pini]|nr:H(+)-ATPase [Globomyces pollinis-pini]